MASVVLFRDGYYSTATIFRITPASFVQLREMGYLLIESKPLNKEN